MFSFGYLVLSFAFIGTCSSCDLHDIDNEQLMNIPVIKALVTRMNAMEARETLHMKAFEELKRKHQLETDKLNKELAMQRNYLNYLQLKVVGQSRFITNSVRRDQLRSRSHKKESGSRSSASESVSPDVKRNGEQMTPVEVIVNRIRRAENDVSVAFTAGLTQSVLHAGPHQNIVFDHVETNVGNSYNPHHGVFTAPVSGIYLFYSSILSEHGGEIWCELAVNGVNKASIYARGTDGRLDQGSQAIIVNLHKGDDVAVRNRNSDHAVFGNSDIYSTFTGVLLQQSFPESGTIIG